MKRVVMVIATVCIATSAFAGNNKVHFGFKDIAFGQTKEQTEKSLRKHYPAKNGADPMKTSNHAAWLRNVEVDGVTCDLDFYFDNNGKLYKYEISSAGYDARQIGDALPHSTAKINDLFAKKFNPPHTCNKPSVKEIAGVQEGRELYNCMWEFPGHNVFTAYRTHEGKFFAFGSVSDKKIEHDFLEHLLDQGNAKTAK